jgi:hypothetical protein
VPGAVAALLLGPALVLPPPAAAAGPQDRAFTIANYPVDATAKDAVAAKDKAIAEGQTAAFRSLLKRLVPVTAYKGLDALKSVKAADLIDGFSIHSEQNSGTQYIANLDFAFEPNSVRDLLKRSGVPFVDLQAEPVTLVPVLRQAATADGKAPAAEFRAASGPWSTVWPGLDVSNSLTPLKIETLKPTVHADTLRALVADQGDSGRILAAEYGSEQVVVAIAEVDKAAGRVHVTLAGQDGVAPILWKRSYRITDNDVAYTLELAAVISLGVLEGRWKAMKTGEFTGADGAGAPDVMLDVQFNSSSEWNEIRGRILDLPTVDDVRVGNVSAYNAQVLVKFPGGGRALAGELGRHGLTVQQSGAGWSVRSAY